MTSHLPLPSQDHLLELFEYSPVTGRLFSRSKNRFIIGDKNKKGYIRDKVDGVKYFRHRLIWRMVTGEDIGELTIDHIDNVPDNNTWHNLTPLSSFDNIMKAVHQTGRQGSIYRHGSGYRNDVWVDGRRHRRYYKTHDDAVDDRDKFIREIEGR